VVAKLTVVGAEQGLVQSRALEGDGGQELLLADPGDIDDLLDPGKTEGVAADAIGVQQCQFATATARLWFGTASCSAVLPALLFMISASGLVMSPGQPRARATKQLRDLQLALLGRQVQRRVAVVVLGD